MIELGGGGGGGIQVTLTRLMGLVIGRSYLENRRHTIGSIMVGQRLRRWPSIEPVLGQHQVYSDYTLHDDEVAMATPCEAILYRGDRASQNGRTTGLIQAVS